MSVQILIGDVRDQLRRLPSEYVDCVVTSPPYWGLRDYGVEGQIGLEPTLGEHLAVMVDVFREVRRVLKRHGTLWLNYGDCYAASLNGKSAAAYKAEGVDDRTFRDKPFSTVGPILDRGYEKTPRDAGANFGAVKSAHGGRIVPGGFLKPKDLCMIPNRLAIALQDDGWWVRSEIIWYKPNPMPESVYDRPTSAHEKIWLLTKGEEYFYNHEAIREPTTGGAHARSRARGTDTGVGWGRLDRIDPDQPDRGRDRIKAPGVGPKSAPAGSGVKSNDSMNAALTGLNPSETRNARNVWTIPPKAFREAHFATFPPALAERCIRAGVPPTVCAMCGAVDGCGGICAAMGRRPGVVLDPFGGAGTVGLVAQQLGLDAILIELNPEYADIARRRIFGTPMAEAAE